MAGRYGNDIPIMVDTVSVPTKQARKEGTLEELQHFCKGGKLNNWNDFCRAWRNGIRVQQQKEGSSRRKDNTNATIAIIHHADMMETIKTSLRQDGPSHIIFPGLKDSFVQLAVEYPCPRAYTLCMWIKVDENIGNGFLLCRCRCPTGGLDIQLSDQQSDGLWKVTMKGSSVEESSASNERAEAVGTVYMTSGRWHLVSIRHSFMRCSKISFVVDGNLEFENEVMYPFHISPVESQWVFGLGLKGQISSVSMYCEDIPLAMLSLLHSKGPHTASLVHGVIRTPQSSFDSGHMTLGTQISKGPSAAKACRLVPTFCITSAHFVPLANLPQIPPGRPNVDHIEMVLRVIEDSPNVDGNTLVPSMTGTCQLSVIDGMDSTMSQADIWLAAGGSMLLILMVQEYVKAINLRYQSGQRGNSSSNITISSSSSYPSSPSQPEDLLSLLHKNMSLLATLLESSADLKEQFIQIHGFHVMGSILSQLSYKHRTITKDTVDCCVELCLSLGTDATKGDGIAAALQGLLFDYRIWGDASDTVKLYLLHGVSNVVGTNSEQLFRCIGLQRLLDVFRLYISPSTLPLTIPIGSQRWSFAAGAVATAGGGEGNMMDGKDAIRVHVECTNVCAKLIASVVEAGLSIAVKSASKLPFYRETEMLCSCLEETTNNLVAEHILQQLALLRVSASEALLHVLIESRFTETTAIGFLGNAGYSAIVRRETLANVIWCLGEQMKHIPPELAILRKATNGMSYYNESSLWSNNAPSSSNTSSSGSVSSRSMSRSKFSVALRPNAVSLRKQDINQQQQMQLRSLIRPIEKAWLVTSMLAEVVAKALQDGKWGDKLGYGTVDSSQSHESDSQINAVQEVLEIFAHDGPLTHISAWLILPLLPILMAHTSSRGMQRALMSLDVLVKTDDSQNAALTALPDRTWIRLLAAIALLGEQTRQKALDARTNTNSTSSTAEISVVMIDHPSSSTTTSPSSDELLSDDMVRDAEMDIGCTSVELALDTIATVMEGKMRYHGIDTWSTWNCLQSCLRSGSASISSSSSSSSMVAIHPVPSHMTTTNESVSGGSGSSSSGSGSSHFDNVEQRLLRRCVSLVLQRLARTTDGWTTGLFTGVANLLMFTEEQRLCGNIPSKSMSLNKSMVSPSSSVPVVKTGIAKSNTYSASSSSTTLSSGTTQPQQQFPASNFTDNNYHAPTSATTFRDLSKASQSPEEYQLLCNIIELMSNLRRVMDGKSSSGSTGPSSVSTGGLHGDETGRRAMRLGLHIILGCMRCTSDKGADRIADEVYAHVVYLSDNNSQPMTADSYKEFILHVFARIQEAVSDPSLPEYLNGRYCALVYQIIHFFFDLRQIQESGGTVASHALPALDALCGVESCNDVKIIFRLLEVSMHTADTISFQEDDAGDELISFGNIDSTGNGGDGTIDMHASIVTDTHPLAVGGGDILSDTDVELDESLHGLDSSFLELQHAQEYATEIRQAQEVLVTTMSDQQQQPQQQQQGSSLSTSPNVPPVVGVDVVEDLLGLGLPSSTTGTSTASTNTLGHGTTTETGMETEEVDTSTFLESALDGGMVAIDGQKRHHLAVALESNLLSMVRGAQAATTTTTLGQGLGLEQGLGQGLASELGSGISPSNSEPLDGYITTEITALPVPEDSKKSGNTTIRNRVLSARAHAKEKLFQSWIKMRQGILLERVDTEKARLARTTRAFQLASEATDKFWTKLRRKIESEYMDDDHACQWKLGVAHEGFFPGRRRVVLRPRFDISSTELGDDGIDVDHDSMDHDHHYHSTEGEWSRGGKGKDPSPRTYTKRRSSMGTSSTSMDDFEMGEVGGLSMEDMASPEGTERLKLALAKSLAGHIQDVTSSAFEGIGGNMDLTHEMNTTSTEIPSSSASVVANTTGGTSDTTLPHTSRLLPGPGHPLSSDPLSRKSSTLSQVSLVSAPGTGWGLVDADGSEEGYGVVGLEPTMVDLLDTEALGHHRYDTDVIAGSDSSHANTLLSSHEVASAHKTSWQEGDGIGMKSSGATAGGSGQGPGIGAAPGPGLTSSGTVAAASGINSVVPVNDHMGDVRLVEDAIREGRGAVETGPQYSGTKKLGGGAVIQKCRVIMVTASGNFWGTLSFNARELFFASSLEPEDGHKEDSAAVNLVPQLRMRRRRWTLSSVSAIYLRRYRLRESAMELFFRRGKHRNFFVDFGHTREDERQRAAFARALMDVAPASCFKQYPSMSPYRLVGEHGVQEKWLAGKLSNFDYLMALNTISGRSFNDLCQYPVMPWILSQYDGDILDLTDPKSYRDLSKPVGALNEIRLRDFLERFHSLSEPNEGGASGSVSSNSIPPFMYGSHYSTMMGVVLHFLVRLQPFASLHKEMQSGHFDVPDRLFSSIPRSFRHNTTQLSEVKELTPEWFTTPEMFRNVNGFDFGITQDGESINDVELPPWAKTAEDFVRINREALESDYVSEHLHEWIDLIFGYKQRGPAAVEACNVFYYLTYSGSVNRDVIMDEGLRRATELQIAHFGQIPMQLFRHPHPAKRTPSSPLFQLHYPGNSVSGVNSAAAAAQMALAPYALPRPLRKSFSLSSQVTLNRGKTKDVGGGDGGTATNPFQNGAGGGGGNRDGISSNGGGEGRVCVDDPFDVFITAEERTSLNVHVAGSGLGLGLDQNNHHNNNHNNNSNSIALPLSSTSSLMLFALAIPENDEEAVAVEASCTLVQRPFSQPIVLAPSIPVTVIPLTKKQSHPYHQPQLQQHHHHSHPHKSFSSNYALQFEPTCHLFVPPGAILSIAILPEKFILILGSGVVEVYRYFTTDTAKTALSLAATAPPNNRRVYKQPVPSSSSSSSSGTTGGTNHEQPSIPILINNTPNDNHDRRSQPPSTTNSTTTSPSRPPPVPTLATTTVSHKSQPLMADLDLLISFDDDHDMGQPGGGGGGGIGGQGGGEKEGIRRTFPVLDHPLHSKPPQPSVPSSVSHITPSSMTQRTLSIHEPLVGAERDVTHFDVLPRLPLTKIFLRRDSSPSFSPTAITGQSSISSNTEEPVHTGMILPHKTSHHPSAAPSTSSSASPLKTNKPTALLYALEQAASLVVFTRSYRLALCAGRVDGSVAVREMDPRNGFILSAGDFSAHRHRVICLAVDSIAYSRTDVIASCDAHGTCLVWTVSRVQNTTTVSGTGHINHPNPALHSYVISRRPQRLFHFSPSQHGRCDISWQMGIVVTVSKGTVSIFSVERDERLKAFDFSCRADEEISSSSLPIFSESKEPFSSTSSSSSSSSSSSGYVNASSGYQGSGIVPPIASTPVDLLGLDDMDQDQNSNEASSRQQQQQQSQSASGSVGNGTASLPASPTRPSATTSAASPIINKFNFGRKSKGLCCGLSTTRLRGHDASFFYPDSDVDGNTAATTSTATTAASTSINSTDGGSHHERDEDVDVVRGIARHLALCDDGIIILHVERLVIVSNENNEGKERKENAVFESSTDPFMTPSFAEGSRYATSTNTSNNTSVNTNASTTGSNSSNSVGAPIIRSEHYLLSYALFGIRTGRMQVSHPITFLETPDRCMDIVVAGDEYGRVTLYRASDLVSLYSFVPHLDCVTTMIPSAQSSVHSVNTHQTATTTASTRASYTSSTSSSSSLPDNHHSDNNHTTANAIICARLGPNPEAPALIIVSSANGALYLRPLPDFVKWERTRVPSALTALVSAPMAAVRGTIMQAQTIAAEAAGVLAENAKTFVTEKLTKSKVGQFFGWGKK